MLEQTVGLFERESERERARARERERERESEREETEREKREREKKERERARARDHDPKTSGVGFRVSGLGFSMQVLHHVCLKGLRREGVYFFEGGY